MLLSGSNAPPTWSSSTFPSIGGPIGNILISDGTNYISSTSLWPNTVGTVGKMVRSNGTINAYTTASFSDIYAVSTLLYASSSNTVSGLATTNRAALSTNSTGIPIWLPLLDGQFVVGSSAGSPVSANLSPGTGISITNGSNTISVASNGRDPWIDQTTASVTMSVNTGYTSDAGASLVTFLLPASGVIGDWLEINGKGSAGWTISQQALQTIIQNASATTPGITSSLSSTNQYDCVRLRCIINSTTWVVASVVGTLTFV